MSNPIPATDEQIAALNADLRRREDEHYFFEASVSLGLSLIARIESEKAQNDYQYEAGFNAALEAIASCDVVTVEEVRSRYGL